MPNSNSKVLSPNAVQSGLLGVLESMYMDWDAAGGKGKVDNEQGLKVLWDYLNHVSPSGGATQRPWTRGMIFEIRPEWIHSKAAESLSPAVRLEEVSRSSIPGPTGLDRRCVGNTYMKY